jgi:flagellar basal-body rod protein FlgC
MNSTGFFRSMAISATGLSAQRLRMNVLSSNLANAQTTRTPEGGPYKRQDVIFSSKPSGKTFGEMLTNSLDENLKEVSVVGIYQDQKLAKKVFDPHHQDADEKGFVRMPNIEVMTEMVNMITATRAYEANTTALNEAKSMALKALEIGRV